MAYPDLVKEVDTLEEAAALLKLLAEPMRLRLLTLLKEKERCVKELVELTGAGQANISKHLSLLSMNGVITRRKKGLYAYYFVSNPSVYNILESTLSTIREK